MLRKNKSSLHLAFCLYVNAGHSVSVELKLLRTTFSENMFLCVSLELLRSPNCSFASPPPRLYAILYVRIFEELEGLSRGNFSNSLCAIPNCIISQNRWRRRSSDSQYQNTRLLTDLCTCWINDRVIITRCSYCTILLPLLDL